MRLKCEVHVSNSLLPQLNLRKPGKSAFTQVSLGRKPGDDFKYGPVYLMLCTAQNRNGSKYVIRGNVQQIFSRFVSEGKATIRFKEPSDDIAFSKADPSQLKMFLKLISLACNGKLSDKALSTLVPASLKQVEKPVTSLSIGKPSEYPMSFPQTLERLTMNNLSLRRISPQITALSSLDALDMSFNSLSSVPDSLSHLSKLRDLTLANNKLTAFPIILCQSGLKTSLKSLNLSHNEITSLPSQFTQMVSLVSLDMSFNKIALVPERLGFMKELQLVKFTDNQLKFLPGSLLMKCFVRANFSNNLFRAELVIQGLKETLGVPSLKEWAARTVVRHRIPYTVEDLDCISISYLKTVRYCQCGKPCFESSIRRIYKQRIPAIMSCADRSDLPFLVHLCSRTCFNRFSRSGS